MSKKSDGLSGSLNDSCFVQAGECLTELCQMIEEESGVKPSLSDLCEILAVSLRGCSSELLSDVDVQAVQKLTPKVAAHKRVRVKPGDVFAVPRHEGGYYFVIYITSNRWGDAFGIFKGHRQVRYLSTKKMPVPLKYPVHTGTRLIISGRWRRIGNREDWLYLFPASPEIFHSKSGDKTNPRIGPYGSGETAAGDLRDLTEAEAIEIGLIPDTYRQIMLGEQFEVYLQEKLG